MIAELPKPSSILVLTSPVMEIREGTKVKVIGMSHVYGYNRFVEVEVLADGTRALIAPTGLCHP